MKNGKCPKCGSSNVFNKKEGLGTDTTGIYVYTSMMTAVSKTNDYICTDCGYFERYIDDKGKLAEVAKKWTKVS